MQPPRIAIPMPHSTDLEYGERAIPQYERAVVLAGGEPVRIPLDQSAAVVRKMIESCAGVLLPGSNADVDPARFKQASSPHTAKADPRRDEVDDLLLDDAYARRKPVLGICYGLQSLNVHRKGSLVQHIPDFLPEVTRTKVNHEAGRKVAVAHNVTVAQNSVLAQILCGDSLTRLSGREQPGGRLQPHNDREGSRQVQPQGNREGHGFSRADTAPKVIGASAPEVGSLILPVNSSHHQSADVIGEGLRIVARCPDDSIIEALEGTAADHFVLAVQWHPERSVEEDSTSRGIFEALIEAAKKTGI
jgi:putative glutamine amidotransferase